MGESGRGVERNGEEQRKIYGIIRTIKNNKL